MTLEVGTTLLLMTGEANQKQVLWSRSACRTVATGWLFREGEEVVKERRYRVAFLEPVDTGASFDGLLELPATVAGHLSLTQQGGHIISGIHGAWCLRFDEGTSAGDAYVCAGRLASHKSKGKPDVP